MSSPSDSVPLPIRILLETEVDEECAVFLQYESFGTDDKYTVGKLIASSELTSATYTITEEFSILCENIQAVTGGANTGVNEIWLDGKETDELAQLFNKVTFNYKIGKEETPELSEED